jgi:hypothetical protein
VLLHPHSAIAISLEQFVEPFAKVFDYANESVLRKESRELRLFIAFDDRVTWA